MRVIKSAAEMQSLKPAGVRAAVFTMGALHVGHAELIKTARAEVGPEGEVVVTIFVNPTQFNDPADLEKYPRTPTADLEVCVAAGADLVFMPSVEEVYPATAYSAGEIGKLFEGASRPGHFDGVATVVARLLEITNPTLTFFGEKDFQQLVVIKQLVAKQNFKVEVRAVPTVRAENGLALSSRNQRLTDSGMTAAPKLFAALKLAHDYLLQAETVEDSLKAAEQLLSQTPEIQLDYFALVDESFTVVPGQAALPRKLSARLIIAAYIDGVRLIDNLAVVRK
jgi:pantoate--beta-alanine ligase